MAEVIQFHCPACCVTLRVPLVASGQQGPCPHCRQWIVAPNPYTQTAAYRLTSEAADPEPSPVTIPAPQPPRFQPFQGVSIPPPDPVLPPAPATVQRPPAVIPAPAPATWPAALGIGITAALLGFAGGFQSATPQPLPPAASPTTQSPHPTPPAPLADRQPDKPNPPTLTAPKEVLDQFLAAADWKSRSEFVLAAADTAPRMETYYTGRSDGPTHATRTLIEHCEASATSNLMLVVFRVFTVECPTGFTVGVFETATGWKVDWESFIEFKDELFIEFVTGKSAAYGKFHLVLLPSTAATEQNGKISYILSDPIKAREFSAQVGKDTPTAATLEAMTRNSVIATPVLELARHAKPDGSYEIEITGIPATNWLPKSR